MAACFRAEKHGFSPNDELADWFVSETLNRRVFISGLEGSQTDCDDAGPDL